MAWKFVIVLLVLAVLASCVLLVSFFPRVSQDRVDLFRTDQGVPYLVEPDAYLFAKQVKDLASGLTGNALFFSKVEKVWFDLLKFFSSRVGVLESLFFFPVFCGVLSTIIFFFLAFWIFRSVLVSFVLGLLFVASPAFLMGSMGGMSDFQVLVMPLSLFFFLGILMLWGSGWFKVMGCFFSFLSLFFLFFLWSGWFFVLIVAGCFFLVWIFLLFIRKDISFKWLFFFGVLNFFIFWVLNLWFGILGKVLSKLGFYQEVLVFALLVEELKVPTVNGFVYFFGGWVFLLVFVFGIWHLLKCVRERKNVYCAIFVLVWFLVLLLPSVRTLRFLFFLFPSSVLVGGFFLKDFYENLLVFFKGRFWLVRFVFLVLVLGVFSQMLDLNVAVLPRAHDGVASAGEWIKSNTLEDSVLVNWWDEGYVWEYFGEREVISKAEPSFKDVWLGRALLSGDSSFSVGVLRGLACGGIITVDVRDCGVGGYVVVRDRTLRIWDGLGLLARVESGGGVVFSKDDSLLLRLLEGKRVDGLREVYRVELPERVVVLRIE